MHARLVFAFSLLFAAPSVARPTVAGRLVHDGLWRTYRLSRPSSPARSLRPVVFVLHGKGQTGTEIMRWLDLERRAERAGAIVVYPDAYEGHWNDGRGAGGPSIHVDDVGFLGKLIERARLRWGGDPARIGFLGISNGALMTYRVGIELGDRISAGAAILGNLPEPLASASPGAPVPFLILNGTEDPLVPHLGGYSPTRGPSSGRFLSTRDTLAFWGRRNGGEVGRRRRIFPDVVRLDGCHVVRTTVETRTGRPVVLYEVVGGGHQIPSPGGFRIPGLGPKARDIDGIQLAWDFLLGAGRPATDLPPARQDGLRRGALSHDGRRRTWAYRLPHDRLPSHPSPVVIVLHGGAKGIGEDIARATGYPGIADREGFIAVFPDGVDGQWNDGRGVGLRDGVDVTQLDDVGFLRRLIDEELPRLNGDPRRVYVVGISSGGMLAHRLGIEIGGRLAGIAAFVSNLPARLARGASPRAPLPVLLCNGTEDAWAPYHGGQARARGRPVGELLSTEASRDFWVQANGGRLTTLHGYLPDRDPNDGTRIERTEVRCARAPVVVLSVLGGGHAVPGDDMPELPRLFGRKSNDVDGPEYAWAWLSQFHR